MAAVTLTAIAAQANQPRIDVAGTVTRTQVFVHGPSQATANGWSATLSAGDQIHFYSMPIPHGAEVIGARLAVCMDTTSTTSVSHAFALGLAYNGSVNYTKYWGSATFSQSAWKVVDFMTAYVATLGSSQPFPVTVSVSDDYQPRYVYPQVTIDSFSYGSLSDSTTIRFALQIQYTYNR